MDVERVQHLWMLLGSCWMLTEEMMLAMLWFGGAGKEMNRLKSLNVMGQKSNLKGPSEVGCTPQGPRVASFGSGGEYPQQQLLNHMRSPQLQMQMQMLMSGSKGGSAYTERYYST